MRREFFAAVILALPILGLEMSPLADSWKVSVIIWAIWGILLVAYWVYFRIWKPQHALKMAFHSPNYLPHRWDKDKNDPITTVTYGPMNPGMFAWFECEVFNHSNTKCVLAGGTLLLQGRKLLFWHNVIIAANIDQHLFGSVSNQYISNWTLDLPAISGPHYINLWCDKVSDLPGRFWPKKLEMVAEFKLVGERRTFAQRMGIFNHDPKAAAVLSGS